MTSNLVESMTVEIRASVLAALGDPIRLRILDEVASCQLCVCDLQEAINIAPNLLSYHLRVLREAGLVTGTRRGRWIDYVLAPEAGALIGTALPDGLVRQISR